MPNTGTRTSGRDYYETLGVGRDATPEAVRDAFRDLALKYHPDRNKEPGAEERFKQIAEAYAVLSDPRKRADYDAGGFAGIGGGDPFAGVDFEAMFRDLGFGLGETIFDRIFRPRHRPRRAADIEIEARVALERIAHGGEEAIRLRREAPCPACKGSGAKAGTKPRACTACGGTGQRVTERRERGVHIRQVSDCRDCGGRGAIVESPCPDCAGTGRAWIEESLAVKIPVGAEDGLVLRIAGKGEAGGEGLAPGDLLVVVRTAPDPRFERNGADLWRLQAIPVTDAVLGAEITVPTLDGATTVKVPPGTQPDSRLRLRGKGLPRVGARGRGDLYVQLAVRVPDRLDAEQRKLWERLRAASGIARAEAKSV